MSSCSFSGYKDCGNFLRSKAVESFPLASSISHEGVFYQHYFDVPPTKEHTLQATFSTATTRDPISEKSVDHFLCLGTTSKYDGAGLRNLGGRPPVDLVFVLDVSGSMSSLFREQSGKEHRAGLQGKKNLTKTKLDAAVESVIGLLENLKSGDSFCLVIFNTEAQVIIPMKKWESDKVGEIKKTLLQLRAGGGTNLTAGFAAAADQFPNDNDIADPTETTSNTRQRRVFFLTDMCMTVGNSASLIEVMKKKACQPNGPIYATIIGYGFDFDVELSKKLMDIPLCNSFSVHSAEEFLHQMTWEFDYLVFPIARDVTVALEDPEAAEIEEMCGSPTDLAAYPPGTLMATSGVFASQTQGNAQESSKGAVMLAKLKLRDPSSPLKIRTTFIDIEGVKHSSSEAITFKERQSGEDGDVFDDLAVRKGVLLSRYVVLLRSYLDDVNSRKEVASLNLGSGIVFGKDDDLGNFGASRVSLDKPPLCQKEYQQILKKFLDHYEREEKLLDDTELAVWRSRLSDYASR